MTASHALHSRKLSLVDVFAIGVNAIVGSGVFSMPDDMFGAMGGFSPLAYLGCALVLLPVALCFAELAGRFEETGGPYLYTRAAFGPVVGFYVGWACFWNALISFAANASLFVELLGVGNPWLQRGAIAVCIAILGAINYLGVRPGAFVVRLMVVGKVIAILCFVAVAITHFQFGPSTASRPAGASAIANGIYLALFPLQGFEVVPVPAGEAKNPRTSVPIGTVGSLLFAALLFMAVQFVIVGAYPRISSDSQTPLVDAARSFGPIIGAVVLIGSIVSVGGFTAGSALGTPRYAQAMAEQGQLPSAFAKRHPRFETPHWAILATCVGTIGLALSFDYRKLVGFSNITVIFQYALTCLAVPVLRSKLGTSRPSAFVVPFGAALPILGALGSLALLHGASRDEFYFAAAALGVATLCLPFVMRRT